ncbi:DNA primase traC (plasmid) [Roseomonas mucosa]|uniref:ArdC family protein n=1 Tax=Roseomonas mucosa TaxID=207340 RepID=UPI00220BD0C0|nr:zincin-like metallopeptidase domain-containing protein [Roseomonas mucosa]QDJ12265.1 DNA primase traC [Roseomonas mucosa]
MTKQRSGKPSTDRRDHYQEVTDRIVAALEAGTRPWQQPWKSGAPGMPVNATTGRRYHGINTLILAMTSFALGGDPRFCSYKQASDRGWQVRKGERGTTVFFFKRMLVEDRDAAPEAEDRTRAIPMLRAYTVFNGAQIDGIPAYARPGLAEAPWCRPEAADIILANSKAEVRFGGDRAFYSPSLDFIQLPEPAAFNSAGDFAATALHEAAHWSGAGHRLNRDLSGRFGSAAYAQEELRAELASVFIGGTLGLPCDIPNHASYVASWARKLKEDKREIFRAAADAQRIADYLLAFHPDYAEAEDCANGEEGNGPGDMAEAA